VDRPWNWWGLVNQVQTAADLEALHRSVQRSGPYGDEA
jgi:hypothetical protein